MRAVITGASGALGGMVLETFYSARHDLVAISRTIPSRIGRENDWVQCGELSEPEAALTAVEAARERLGGIDTVIHLAGAFGWTHVSDSTVTDWRRLFAANVETTLSVVQASAPFISDNGSIVCVGAAAAEPAGEGMAPYAAAKSGLARLVEALAIELRPRKIRANAVLPAIIDTPSNRAEMPGVDPTQWTKPSAIADVILFLSSPSARAINGANIPVTNAA